jgi:ketosteroid isomerase-like protein
MSERNVELHRRFGEAFNARDIEAMLALCDPSIEWHSAFAAVGGAVHHGHDGMRRCYQDDQDVWGDELRAEAEAFIDLGEHTLSLYVVHARGQQSRTEVAMRGAQVVKWRDGLIVYAKGYVHREDALRDLSLSEDELQRIDP